MRCQGSRGEKGKRGREHFGFAIVSLVRLGASGGLRLNNLMVTAQSR